MTLKQLREKRKAQAKLIADNPKLKEFSPDLGREERRLIHERNETIKKLFKLVSNAVLWFCAVGGFALALIQFLAD